MSLNDHEVAINSTPIYYRETKLNGSNKVTRMIDNIFIWIRVESQEIRLDFFIIHEEANFDP
mgnify:CR=1 FL=1